MPATPTPKPIPSNTDYAAADLVAEGWLARWSTGVAPHSNAANDLRDRIAELVADRRHGELVAEQGDGPIELDPAFEPAALAVLVRRLRDRAALDLADDVAMIPTTDGTSLPVVARDKVLAWLSGMAVRLQDGGSL